jgi:predicted lipase
MTQSPKGITKQYYRLFIINNLHELDNRDKKMDLQICALLNKQQKELAYIMAQFARDAYLDDSSATLAKYGFDVDYLFLEKENAEGHVACNDTEIIITFRGTQPTQLSDLLADLDTIPKKNGPGFVHAGFRKEARKLYELVFDYIKAHPNRKIYVTGHSLGAAMATYMAQEIKWNKLGDPTLYTFGSPRLGSHDFVRAMDIEHHRYVNCLDIVTHVPPNAIGFMHHGQLNYINYYGFVRNLTTWQKMKDQMRAHWHSWKKGRLFDGIDYHSMDLYVQNTYNTLNE